MPIVSTSLLGYDDLTIGIIKTVPYLSDLQTRKFFQRSLRRKTTYGWDGFTRLIRMPFPLPPFLTPIRRKGWALWIDYASFSSSLKSIGICRLKASLKEMTVSVRAKPKGCNFLWIMLNKWRLSFA